jgi:hypothetical protein
MATNDPDKWGQYLKKDVYTMKDRLVTIVEETIEDAAVVMRDTIMTTGTNKQWKSPWRGRNSGYLRYGSDEARYDMGWMKKAVKARMKERTQTKASGEFGWLDQQEDYYIYQDQGFTHWITGDKIPAMNALRDAATFARVTIEKRLRDIFQ